LKESERRGIGGQGYIYIHTNDERLLPDIPHSMNQKLIQYLEHLIIYFNFSFIS